MTHKVTVRFGGAADSEVHDYSDRVHLLGDGSPLIYGGMACDNGTAGMGQLILDDEDNDIPHRTDPPGLQLAAHNQLIWSEDSPGYESWLSIGRIDNKSVGRPYTRTAGVNRQWTVQWADANIDFDGLTLTEDWVRPAESDVDRVLAAVAAFCNGSPRLTTVFETHKVATTSSVTMPAKTYPAGTELPELFDDCASQAGKQYSVVIHDLDSASHTCLQYIDEEDHTTYACTLSISDQLDEVDGETVFEPVWRQGGATEEQGQELITGLVSRYGLDTTATVVVTDSDHADAYDYWVKPYNDDLAATATEATNRATAMVHARWNEHVTHQPSILIPARLHHLLKAGMSIPIKSAAAMGGQYLNTVQTRRIANIEWSHAGWRGTDALLWANLQLDRTPRKLPLSIGTKPGPQPAACDGSPEVVTSWLTVSDFDTEGMTITGDPNECLLILAVDKSGTDPSFTYDADALDATSPTQAFSKVDEYDATASNGHTPYLSVWKLDNPAASNGANGQITAVSFGSDAGIYVTLYLRGVNLDSLVRTTARKTVQVIAGAGTTPQAISNTVSAQANDLVVSLVGMLNQQESVDDPACGSDQTLLQSERAWKQAGIDGTGIGVSTQTGAGTQTNSWTACNNGSIGQLDLVLTGCDDAITIGGPGDGTTGDGGYVPGGTVVEHGDLSGKGGTMHDATQIEFDSTGLVNTSAVEVQSAIEDLDAAISGGGAPTTVDYLVGTASAGLSAEIVVGTSPGGELGGTWASPTVDTTHSGSAHHTENHATRHSNGGADEVSVENLGTAETDSSLVLAPDGTGGVEFRAETGGGGSLTVEEVDGSPTDSAVTKLVFPNGTLGITSHVATYTPASGGGGMTQAFVGKNAIGGTWASMTQAKIIFKKVVLANDCLITSIEAYISEADNTNQVDGWGSALYADNGSTAPGALIHATPIHSQHYLWSTGSTSTRRGRWFGQACGKWVAAGTYWLAVVAWDPGGVQIAKDGSGSDVTATTGGNWWPDGEQYTNTTTTDDYSIRANTMR